MEGRKWIGYHECWPPVAVRFRPNALASDAGAKAGVDSDGGGVAGAVHTLRPAAGPRLPPLWRFGYRCSTRAAGVGLVTVATLVALVAGLLGSLVFALGVVLLSLPVWIAWRWPARPRIGGLSRKRSGFRGRRG